MSVNQTLRCCSPRFRVISLLSVLSLVLDSPASAQGSAVVLLVSQPSSAAVKSQFVDLAPHLQPALQETGKYSVIVFKSTNASILEALKAGRLQQGDILSPLSRETSHKVAKAVGAGGVLTVSAESTKDGVSMSALLEVLAGQNTWNQVYLDQVAAPKQNGKKVGLLESIHGLVDRIVQKMTNANVQTVGGSTEKPIAPPKPPDDGKPNIAADPIANADTTKSPAAGNPGQPTVSKQPTAASKQSNISTYTLVIDRARRNGDMASLIVALRKAINERPKDVRLRRDLASAYKERGWNDLSKEEASRAVTLAPEDGSVHRLLGDVLLDSGDRPGALREYQEAVRLTPQDPLSHMALGDALVADGHTEEGLKEFQAAAQADDKSPVPHVRIARLSIVRGSYADGLVALNTAKSIVGTGDSSPLIADCAAILNVVEATLLETLPRLQQTRAAFSNGTKTREEAFKTVTALRKRIDDLSTFLDAMPDLGLGQPQALYSQASSLAVQATDKLLEHLETQSTSAAEESNLLRIEANKQIGEASKRLKSATDPKSDQKSSRG